MVERAKEQPEYEVAEGAPEYYVDSAFVNTQLYGSTIRLGSLRAPGELALVRVSLKVSPPMLKVLSLILSKHVKHYEGSVGPIAVPKQLLHSLGLEELI